MTKKTKWFANGYLTLVFVLLYVPIFYLIMYSFSTGKTMSHYQGFTWAHYVALFQDARMIQIALDTLLLALLSALIATAIGSLGALGIYATKKRQTRNALLSLNNILMVSPDVIIGASFLIFFTFLGIGLGFGSVLMSHIAFEIPIVVLMVLPRLQEMSTTMIDAAEDLGASSWQVLSRVILPAIIPGILAGYFMAFTYSLDDFAVTFFVTGNGFETLSIEIYARARQGIDLEVNALSGILFVFALLLVVGYYLLTQYTAKRQKAGVKRP
ncbi:spermidine putrescine ABC transporter permease protein [Lactobacillus selangorensis]|uniref:Spermidine putrescine ABC transporter permease protein n=1 Tax=Lactobacillus selangorensis TaxID=81857 RepID=A0A0R2FP84_9LACO|nr:ABC transporter permease [Lactobacillus selangorensis]KRN27672.1 spermidine putrescine ABC transporter permease protein [Lactobacillus selangorensis]KRN30361.1 spermidine putrescine ABC transporter permease protein [Lactobacillus selangorensis]